jgi:RNA polymerase sigma-70 factor (ECF subfamily)
MPVKQEDEAGLLVRVGLGDRKAFAALYAATSAKLFSVLLRILRNRNEAEDALQDLYVKIWHQAHRYVPDRETPVAWLTTLARNHAIDMMRARRPEGQPIEEAYDLASDDPGPEQAAIRSGEASRIADCMRKLDSDRAGAVRLAYVEGLSYQELAESYNVPLNTMRTWLRRSLLRLRECLGP